MPDFPKAATPTEVWAAPTRALTDKVGFGLADDAITAAKIAADAIGASELAQGAADKVWGTTARTITALTGTPRTDLMGEDASLETGTGVRKVRIDRLASIEAFEAPTEGSASFLTTDTYPKTVTIALSEIGVKHVVECYVDLTAVVEALRVDQSISVVTPVAYKLYAQESYTGAQTLPMLFVSTKPARYGLKIDLYMAVAPAANRSFPWQWFRRRIA